MWHLLEPRSRSSLTDASGTVAPNMAILGFRPTPGTGQTRLRETSCGTQTQTNVSRRLDGCPYACGSTSRLTSVPSWLFLLSEIGSPSRAHALRSRWSIDSAADSLVNEAICAQSRSAGEYSRRPDSSHPRSLFLSCGERRSHSAWIAESGMLVNSTPRHLVHTVVRCAVPLTRETMSLAVNRSSSGYGSPPRTPHAVHVKLSLASTVRRSASETGDPACCRRYVRSQTGPPTRTSRNSSALSETSSRYVAMTHPSARRSLIRRSICSTDGKARRSWDLVNIPPSWTSVASHSATLILDPDGWARQSGRLMGTSCRCCLRNVVERQQPRPRPS